MRLQDTKSLAQAVAGNAAADGIKLGDQAVHRLSLGQRIETVLVLVHVQGVQAILTKGSPHNSYLAR